MDLEKEMWTDGRGSTGQSPMGARGYLPMMFGA